MSTHRGSIDCPSACPVPPGVVLLDIPPPRHAWADVIICPGKDCVRCFLVVREEVAS